MARRKKTGWRRHKTNLPGLTPLKVIEGRAKKLKRNPRAAAVYRKVLAV